MANACTFFYKTKIINKTSKSSTIREWQVGVGYQVQPAIADAILKIGVIMAEILTSYNCKGIHLP